MLVSITAFGLIFLLQSIRPLFSTNRWAWKHGVRNMAVFLINTLVMAVLVGGLRAWVLQTSHGNPYSLVALLKLSGAGALIATLLLFDLWMYWWHRLLHRVPLLWRFHRMHHSDLAMDVTTTYRFHIGELLISACLRCGVFYIIGMNLTILLCYELIMTPVIAFHHSNFYLPTRLDRMYRCVFTSPWMHWLHHSDYQPETDSNFGTVLSCWDRLFGTYCMTDAPQQIRYGLKEFRDPKWQTLGGLIKTPLA